MRKKEVIAPTSEEVARGKELTQPQPESEPTPVETLKDYAERMEEQAQPLTVCEITHPQAVHGAIHTGKYSGIRLVKGDTLSTIISDGSVL